MNRMKSQLPSKTELQTLYGSVHAMVKHVHLPFREVYWRGQSGTWAGRNVGCSIDFMEHREYVPGDDVRHIDWNAFARTRSYILKLYREEVSPTVDVVLDCSASMFFDADKARRTMELLYFCVESAQQWGVSSRVYMVAGSHIQLVSSDKIQSCEQIVVPSDDAPSLAKIPWRLGCLKVVLSDLLYAVDPDEVLKPIVRGGGKTIIFAPYCVKEQSPEWGGNIQFEDCENEAIQEFRITETVLGRYVEAYRRHFSSWQAASMKHAVTLARINSDLEFRTVLLNEAVPMRAAQVWG